MLHELGIPDPPAPPPAVTAEALPSRVQRLGEAWRRSRKLVFFGAAFYVLAFATWEATVALGLWPRYLLPSFTDVAAVLVENAWNGRLLLAVGTSLQRLALGYGLALVLGLALGIAMGRSRVVHATLGSLTLGLQTLPSIAWLPLALIWFGLDESAILFVVVMGVVFAIAMATSNGIRSTPPLLERAAKNLGARGDGLLYDLYLPSALPHIVAGMKQGWSFAWRSLIAAEMVYSATGLGHLLMMGRELNDLTLVVAMMIVIILVGIAAEGLLFGRLEAFVRHRWGLGSR